ncbi:hypothetical protein ACFFJT_15115 [Dyella flava]|uniref:Uncharacterized protein n=1 Tax=Dyella flava TaxID=1920170 RepID=A0ABS2K2V7_9GAMM|nr:hypothetical protein [Dyella flava]MBM7125567.1 hypothetical protein [Dyella flava]GLQ51571.1 hypothetical protein GCM10010872_30200 [Dyella flava]
MSDTTISAASTFVPPIAPTEQRTDLTASRASDPNLQNKSPSTDLAMARTGTAELSVLTSAAGDSYGLTRQLKGVPAPSVFNQIYTPLRTVTKGIDLPFRIAVYAPSINDRETSTVDKIALITKVATAAADLGTEAGLVWANHFNNKNNMQLEHVLVTRPAPATPTAGDIPLREFGHGRVKAPITPSNPDPETTPPASANGNVHDRTSIPTAPPEPDAPHLAKPQPFDRNAPSRIPTKRFNMTTPGEPFARGSLDIPDPPFIRYGAGRRPVMRIATPVPSSSLSTIKGLNYASNGIGALSSLADIYFGMKAVVTEREPLAKTQGAAFALAGTTGVAATGLGSMSVAEMGGAAAAAAATGLSVVSAGAAAVGLGLNFVPLTHGHDNRRRAYKVHNDLSYDVKQLALADHQLTQRTGQRIRSDLLRLNARYGVEPKTVWLNNNGADLMNEINSPNNTASGQWKPDADGKVWSDFRDKYIRINGTPHQETSSLNLACEHDGVVNVPAPRTTVNIPGDENPDKTPQPIQTPASDASLYTAQGWRHSTQQPWLYKDYGYQTSDWGYYWETSIPASVSAGPLYVAHDAVPEGKDRVVLIEDTRLASTPALPKDHYAETSLFQFNGNDAQLLNEPQIGELIHDKKPVAVPAAPGDRVQVDGMKLNASESHDKQQENAYREAVYPMDSLPHARSPDAFHRTIETDPSARTVVSLPYIRRPVTIIARNPNDVIDLPQMPEADMHVTLPAVDAAIDKRQLGLSDRNSLRRQTASDAPTQVYVFSNGKTLTVQAENAASAARFVQGLT